MSRRSRSLFTPIVGLTLALISQGILVHGKAGWERDILPWRPRLELWVSDCINGRFGGAEWLAWLNARCIPSMIIVDSLLGSVSLCIGVGAYMVLSRRFASDEKMMRAEDFTTETRSSQ